MAAIPLRHTGREVMEYDGRMPGDGWWNCPYPPEWVDRKKQAVRACEKLTDEQVEAALIRAELHFVVLPGDFLSEPQDERGLPLSWRCDYEARHEGWPECCVATYDYDTIPEIVATDGEEDWPMRLRDKILTA